MAIVAVLTLLTVVATYRMKLFPVCAESLDGKMIPSSSDRCANVNCATPV